MANDPPRPVRVALTAPGSEEMALAAFGGVLEYKQRVEHWRLVSAGVSPMQPFNEIDLGSVDGVIGILRDPHCAPALQKARVSAVNFSNAVNDVELPRVACDDVAIGRMGAKHLLDRGVTHFAFLGLSRTWFSGLRRAGFAEVIESTAGRGYHHIEVDLSRFRQHPEQISEWLIGLPKPVAVMTANDMSGRLTIDAAMKLGLRVPDDVAVLGVNNDRWQTQLASIPLSSVQPDWRQMGFLGAKLLDSLMSGEPPPDSPMRIAPIGVVTRQSTSIVMSEDPIARRAMEYIETHCGEQIHVEDVLDALDVSRRTLETRLRRAIGQTPQNAIYRAQVERAKRMLASTDATIHEIMDACGFEREDRLYIVFKRLAGMTPGQYRRRFSVTGAGD
jgi:LacI family transcriptional regulator